MKAINLVALGLFALAVSVMGQAVQPASSESGGKRFSFVYAGNELGSGEFVVYRFDHESGAIVRFVYARLLGDEVTGRPLVDVSTWMNLTTGESGFVTSESDQASLDAWRAAQSESPDP